MSSPGLLVCLFTLSLLNGIHVDPHREPSTVETSLQTVPLVDLAHPDFRDLDQVNERLELCRRFLAQRSDPVDQEPSTRTMLAQYFLWFADSSREARGDVHYLTLSEWQSPAVDRLERQLGLPVPDGWVFVREFAGFEQMPPPIRAAFERQSGTQAVTFLSRYVAVLRNGADSTPEFLRQKRARQILEHELVHVVLNSYLGIHASDLPLWFHEGCAVAFSGEPGSQTVGFLSDGSTGLHWVYQQWSLAVDYREYQGVFNYLKRRLGPRVFHQQVRQAISTHSVKALLTSVRAANYEDLRRQASQWQRRRENIIWTLGCLVLGGLGLLYWRRLPRTPKPASEVV